MRHRNTIVLYHYQMNKQNYIKTATMENRLIKFRIPHYNIKDNKFSHFSYWGTIDVADNPSLDGGTFTSPSSNSHTYKKWHEQYMGKDKNGKEICEGDIINCGKDELFKVEFFDDTASFILFGCETGKARWIENRKTFRSEYQINISTSESVGNIHQNPELLTPWATN